jgi:hypothetical protein
MRTYRQRGGMFDRLPSEVNAMIGDYVPNEDSDIDDDTFRPTHSDHMRVLSKFSQVNKLGQQVYNKVLYSSAESVPDMVAFLGTRAEPWKSFAALCRNPTMTDEFLHAVAKGLWKIKAVGDRGIEKSINAKRPKTSSFLLKRGLLANLWAELVSFLLEHGRVQELDLVKRWLPSDARWMPNDAFLGFFGLGSPMGFPLASWRWLCSNSDHSFVNNVFNYTIGFMSQSPLLPEIGKLGCDMVVPLLSGRLSRDDQKVWLEALPALREDERIQDRIALFLNMNQVDIFEELDELVFFCDVGIILKDKARSAALVYLRNLIFEHMDDWRLLKHLKVARYLIDQLGPGLAPPRAVLSVEAVTHLVIFLENVWVEAKIPKSLKRRYPVALIMAVFKALRGL